MTRFSCLFLAVLGASLATVACAQAPSDAFFRGPTGSPGSEGVEDSAARDQPAHDLEPPHHTFGGGDGAGDPVCDLTAFNGSAADAAPTLQDCIRAAADGQTLRIPAGRYTLANPVKVDRAIRLATQGLSDSAPACANQLDGRCATLVTTGDFWSFVPMLTVTVANAAIDHLILDGDGFEWRSRHADVCGIAAETKRMFTLALGEVGGGASGFMLTNSVVFNAKCGAGVWAGYADNQTFSNNRFLSNGAHAAGAQWAVGIEFSGGANLVFRGNRLEHNSDGDLQLGDYCRDCQVADNTFVHDVTVHPEGAAHCALCVGPYAYVPASTLADYTGTIVEHNYIECGPHANQRWGCGAGLDWGQHPWNSPALIQNGIVRNNTINNALIGVLIDAATGTVFDNNPVYVGNPDAGCLSNFVTDRITAPMPYFLSVDSSVVRYRDGTNPDGTPNSDVFSRYTLNQELTGFIPNIVGRCGS